MSGFGRRSWLFGLAGLGLAAGLAGAQDRLSAALADGPGTPEAAGPLEEVLPGALDLLEERVGQAWGAAVLIEAGVGQAYAPQIAMDADGNAFAVWVQRDGSANSIWANRYAAGQGWGAAQIIETSPWDTYVPHIATDASGNAFAVWAQDDPGTSLVQTSIWANRYTAGTGWGTAQLIEVGADTAFYPQIAMNSNGDALVVWLQDHFSIHQAWATHYAAGSGWGTEVRIDNGGYSVYPPQVAMDATGNGLAVWTQYNGVIAANRYAAGTGWGTAAGIVTNGHDPQVAMNASGSAFAVWAQYDGTFYRIYSKRYLAGTGWDAAELIDSDVVNDLGYPQIDVDAAGDAFVVWTRYNGAYYNVYTAMHPAATTWGMAVPIDGNTGSAGAPQIAVNANGDAFAVWYQSDGTRYNICSNRRLVTDTGWGTAELIETDSAGSAYDPQVVVGANSALAVWRQNDGTRDNVWANHIELDLIFKDGFE